MAKVIIAEGGRSWPKAPGADPCGNDWNDVCGPEDINAWGRRLTAEANAANNHLSGLAPAGYWIGPVAESLAAEINAWRPIAAEWADTDYWDTPQGAAHALAAYGGWMGVIQEITDRIALGIDLNNRARVMIWEASQQPPAPDPESEPDPDLPPYGPEPPPPEIDCPPGYTPVWITQPDGTVMQFCQGQGGDPVHPDQLDAEGKPKGGGGGLIALGAVLVLGGVLLYSNRGSISGSILSGLRK
jgi:hypothetical protein